MDEGVTVVDGAVDILPVTNLVGGLEVLLQDILQPEGSVGACLHVVGAHLSPESDAAQTVLCSQRVIATHQHTGGICLLCPVVFEHDLILWLDVEEVAACTEREHSKTYHDILLDWFHILYIFRLSSD